MLVLAVASLPFVVLRMRLRQRRLRGGNASGRSLKKGLKDKRLETLFESLFDAERDLFDGVIGCAQSSAVQEATAAGMMASQCSWLKQDGEAASPLTPPSALVSIELWRELESGPSSKCSEIEVHGPSKFVLNGQDGAIRST